MNAHIIPGGGGAANFIHGVGWAAHINPGGGGLPISFLVGGGLQVSVGLFLGLLAKIKCGICEKILIAFLVSDWMTIRSC